METEVAARIFYDWAATEGLIKDPIEPKSNVNEFAAIAPVQDSGKTLLRAKQVQAVGFNEPERQIVVFTRKAVPISKKAMSALPQTVDDVEITYRQGAQETIGEPPSLPYGGPPYSMRQSAGANRYTCGSSVSVGNYRDAGTMGCLVRNATGDLFGLSNNHVTGACNYANVNLPIVAPGIADVVAGGQLPFTIGLHAQALSMVAGSPDNIDHLANFDAAIFKILDGDIVSSYQRDAYDTPAVVAQLSPNLQVEKVGRTTGRTHGKVISQIYGPLSILYNTPLYEFTGHVFFEPAFAISGTGGALFSDHGDSGSLITTVENGVRRGVGIVVGGMADKSAPGGKTTIALPLAPLLAKLQLTLVSGHNV